MNINLEGWVYHKIEANDNTFKEKHLHRPTKSIIATLLMIDNNSTHINMNMASLDDSKAIYSICILI